MEKRENMSLIKEELESSSLIENSKVALVFELCLQPKTKEDLDNILLAFRERIKSIQLSENFGVFDFVSIYVLDYVYKHHTASFCSVSRSLYLYQMVDQLVLEGESGSAIYNCDNECLFKMLQEFTSVYTYSKSEEMLVDVGLCAILAGNVGLALYMVKFGLIEFPSEVNGKCKKMFEILVSMFNSCFKPVTRNQQEGDMQISVQLNELLNQVKEKETNIRRCIPIFCILTIAAEYKMYEKLGERAVILKFYTEHRRHLCLRKLVCINLYIQATMELKPTFRDIENFTDIILSPFLTAEVGKSLVDTCRKLLDNFDNFYNPRSLKDLARLKVRSIFRKSLAIPEQVNELDIPTDLKKFLNFHGEGIWELLVINQLYFVLEHKLNRHASETEDGNVREVDDGNVRELEGGNEQELEDGSVAKLEDGSVAELEDGNVRELEDRSVPELPDGSVPLLKVGNVLQLENGSVPEIECGNVAELEDGNVSELEDGNVPELKDGNVPELEDGNVPELEDGNVPELEDGNGPELEDGNGLELEDGNVPELPDGCVPLLKVGNVSQLEDGSVPELECGNVTEMEDGNLLELDD